MSRVIALAKSGRSSTAKFHELRLKYWTSQNDLVCCFEGSDDVEFFLPRIRGKVTQKKVDFLICEGKSTVLNLWREATDRSWNLARIGFFVDRDLDDFINGNPQDTCVHVTQYYSFESHALDEEFFRNVWQYSFRLSLNDDRFATWRNAYFEGAAHFAKLIFPVFYFALATKRERGDVDFDKINLPDVVNISDSGAVRRVQRKKRYNLPEIFPTLPPSRKNLRESRKELGKNNYRNWLRGKFLLWYSMTFLSRMKAALTRRGQPNRANIRINFNDETAITCLCSRAEVPQTLAIFLDNWTHEIEKKGTEPKGARLEA
ncbi:DUF4435 domain-containing protein [Achromobacter xylosoxidans]